METIKLEYGIDSEGKKFKDGVQDGRQLASKDLFDHKNNLDIKHFNFDFIWMFVDLILQLIK